jgi:hypothetical protein
MKLRFFAKDDDLVYVPTSVRMSGQAPQYIGRRLEQGNDGRDGQPRKAATFPATEEAWECDADSADADEILNRFRRGKRRLWPADAETAAACGVEFVRVVVKAGVAVPAPIQPAVSSRASRASAGSDS